MKRNELMIIVVVALLGVGVAYVVANKFLGSVTSKPAVINTVDKFDTEFTEPDPNIFNANAINPTIPIVIDSSDSSEEN